MKINAMTIPHAEQRYETCGDWWFDPEGTLQVRTSDLQDWRKEACILVHEIVEALICQHRGITPEAVDTFDKAFEAARIEGNDDEPGDDPRAPYYNEHQIATAVERLLAQQLGVSWKEYDTAISSASMNRPCGCGLTDHCNYPTCGYRPPQSRGS